MNIIQKADEWLVGQAEIISWWSEYNFSIDRLVLARVAYGAGVCTSVYVSFGKNIVGTLIFFLVYILVLDRAIRNDLKRYTLAGKTINPMRNAWAHRGVRIVVSILLVSLLHTFTASIKSLSSVTDVNLWPVLLGAVVMMYFLSCNPLPPGYQEEKEREAAERTMHRST